MVSAGSVRSPSCMMGEFPSDKFFDAVGEVVEAVEALEETAAGHRASRGYWVRGVSRIRQEDAVNPEASKWEGIVEYWHVRRYESTMRIEKSSAGPRSVVDRGVARTKGVWSPRRMGTRAVPMFCWTRVSWGTVRNGVSGWPTSWFLGSHRSVYRPWSGGSRRSACL
jgi:hypothetical protein